MLWKPAATSHSMHNLEMFTKDVLLYMSCYIHSCPWLYFWPAVTCCYLAPNLLNNVDVCLLTLSSMLPWLLLVIHAPYELVLAILSFINMSFYCWLPCHAMYCSVVSGSSSPTCLLIVPAMYESVISLAMFIWVPSYFLILFGSWSVKDFCSMCLVVSCHALSFYDKFL